MRKKVLSLLLGISVVASLAGCGSSTGGSADATEAAKPAT